MAKPGWVFAIFVHKHITMHILNSQIFKFICKSAPAQAVGKVAQSTAAGDPINKSVHRTIQGAILYCHE